MPHRRFVTEYDQRNYRFTQINKKKGGAYVERKKNFPFYLD